MHGSQISDTTRENYIIERFRLSIIIKHYSEDNRVTGSDQPQKQVPSKLSIVTVPRRANIRYLMLIFEYFLRLFTLVH